MHHSSSAQSQEKAGAHSPFGPSSRVQRSWSRCRGLPFLSRKRSSLAAPRPPKLTSRTRFGACPATNKPSSTACSSNPSRMTSMIGDRPCRHMPPRTCPAPSLRLAQAQTRAEDRLRGTVCSRRILSCSRLERRCKIVLRAFTPLLRCGGKSAPTFARSWPELEWRVLREHQVGVSYAELVVSMRQRIVRHSCKIPEGKVLTMLRARSHDKKLK